MRKMKDSGIEWIGEIPEGWEITRLKHLADFEPTCDTSYLTDESKITYTPMECVKNGGFENRSALYGNLSHTLTPFQNGDIAMAKVTPCFENGNIAIMDNLFSGFGLGSSELFIFRPKSISTRYFFYWLQNKAFVARACSTMTGTGGLKRISPSFIRNCPVHCPSTDEQTKISDYLDAKCSKIDDLLTSVHASIEEYKKLKQAVITQAVTKGVRGEREMKDSGVEWIGKIPGEFDPVQLKFFCKLITDGTHFSPTTVENGWPYITAGDVHGIGLDYNSAKRISEEDFQLLVAQGCQPLKGDVLLVKDGATTGRVGFVDSDTPCVILSSVAMLRPADNTDGHYLMYLLASDFLQKQILVSMAGSAMPRTTLTKLTKYIGLLPPLHEQKEIANYLDAKCAKIDRLIAKKEQLVKELESYKKSLIYEVVTGKREV